MLLHYKVDSDLMLIGALSKLLWLVNKNTHYMADEVCYQILTIQLHYFGKNTVNLKLTFMHVGSFQFHTLNSFWKWKWNKLINTSPFMLTTHSSQHLPDICQFLCHTHLSAHYTDKGHNNHRKAPAGHGSNLEHTPHRKNLQREKEEENVYIITVILHINDVVIPRRYLIFVYEVLDKRKGNG